MVCVLPTQLYLRKSPNSFFLWEWLGIFSVVSVQSSLQEHRINPLETVIVRLILTVSEQPLFPWLQGDEKGLPYLEVQHPETCLISASPLSSAWLPDVSVEGAEGRGVQESSVSDPHTEHAGWIRNSFFFIFNMILVGTEVCSEALWNFWLYILRPIVQGRLHFSDFGGKELRNFSELNGQERGPRTQGPRTECQKSKRSLRPGS